MGGSGDMAKGVADGMANRDDDGALLRYARHLLLDEIGIEGQARIGRARVLVIGAGGLGSPAAIYLAAAGVGRLVVVDDDDVDLTNLQRQILHTTGRIGQPKADSAAIALRALNPDVAIEVHRERLVPGNAGALVAQSDCVLDCSDNRATRYALNRACHRARVPLVSGSASGFAGQLAVFDFRLDTVPCYACLFPEGPGADDNCATTGVFAPLTGVVGALQAGEALRLVCGFGPPASGQLLAIDAAGLRFEALRFAPDPACTVCGTGR
jgi:molybdopterin/thiamine biosynthesis adenylyltransferase